MGRINIIGGSKLKMAFLDIGISGPVGDKDVKLKKRATTKRNYDVTLPFEAVKGGANMRVTFLNKNKVVIEYDEKPKP